MFPSWIELNLLGNFLPLQNSSCYFEYAKELMCQYPRGMLPHIIKLFRWEIDLQYVMDITSISASPILLFSIIGMDLWI